MDDKSGEKALDRLLALPWKEDPKRAKSNVELFREFLRRMTLWAKRLDRLDDWPFFDIMEVVQPDLPIPDELISRLFGGIPAWISETGTYIYVRRLAVYYLHWSMGRHLPQVTQYELPDPFEPLILAFERGGLFTREQHHLDIGVISISIAHWSTYDWPESFVELTDHALDATDQA